jgi:hypothetical protein
VSPYIAGLIGYVNVRDAQLQGANGEADNLKLDAAVVGGKLGFVFLPQANFNFFLEARYYQIIPKYSRKILTGPTVSQSITSSSSEEINFSAYGIVLGFTVYFGR